MNSKKSLRLPGVLFVIIGAIFIIAGSITIYQGNSLKQRCTEEAIGTVVEVICETSYSSDENEYTYTYYPVIEYQAGSRTISQRSKSGQTPPKYKVGEQVVIYYNPNNVEEFIIKGDATPQYLGIGFVVIGSIAVLVGFVASIKNVGRSGRSSDSSMQIAPDNSDTYCE